MLAQKPWPPVQVLQLLMRLFVSMFVGVLLASLLNSTHWLGTGTVQFLTLLISIVSFHGVALVLTHFLLCEESIYWREAFGFVAPRLGRALVLALLVAFGVLPIAWSLAEVSAKFMQLLHLKPTVQDPVQMLQTAVAVPMRVLIGFLAVAVAPLAEEVIFRGLIYPTIKQQGFPRLALWGTSFLFAAVHHNLAVLLPLTFLAVVWTLLYETTGNLLAPIFAHALFNLLNLFWVITQPGGVSNGP